MERKNEIRFFLWSLLLLFLSIIMAVLIYQIWMDDSKFCSQGENLLLLFFYTALAGGVWGFVQLVYFITYKCIK